MNARRGFTLLELTVTCLILAALLLACLQLLGATATARRAAGLRQTALEEARNALERIYACDYRELSTERAQRLAPAERTAGRLPAGKLEIAVDPLAAEPPAKRITVTASWQSRPHEPRRTLRLVAWKYPLSNREGSR